MNSRRHFIASFWTVFGVVGGPLVIALALAWHPFRAVLPPTPPMPLFGDSYIADYYGVGSAPHYLYRFGIFGMGERLRQSDVLLMGSSHVEMGLSAAQLSAALSQKAKRNVGAYNLGLSFGEGTAFDRDIVLGNGLQGTTAIVDLFASDADEVSAYATKVQHANILSAYYQVFQLWMTCLSDDFLDPLLPRFYPQDLGVAKVPGMQSHKGVMGLIAPRRFLLILTVRSWSTGDAVLSWSPDEGIVSTRPPPPNRNILYGKGGPQYQYISNIGVYFPEKLTSTPGIDLSLIYTLLPFEGYERAKVPVQATPYIPIDPAGLTFFEGMHLNSDGRVLATDRLASGIDVDSLRLAPPVGAKSGTH